jgi:hypothetical protein
VLDAFQIRMEDGRNRIGKDLNDRPREPLLARYVVVRTKVVGMQDWINQGQQQVALSGNASLKLDEFIFAWATSVTYLDTLQWW